MNTTKDGGWIIPAELVPLIHEPYAPFNHPVFVQARLEAQWNVRTVWRPLGWVELVLVGVGDE